MPQQQKSSKQTTTTSLSKEDLNSQFNSQPTAIPEQLVEVIPIEGTPFTANRSDKVWCLCWGIYAISPEMESKKQVLKYLRDNMWNVVASLAISIADAYNKKLEFEKENEKQKS